MWFFFVCKEKVYLVYDWWVFLTNKTYTEFSHYTTNTVKMWWNYAKYFSSHCISCRNNKLSSISLHISKNKIFLWKLKTVWEFCNIWARKYLNCQIGYLALCGIISYILENWSKPTFSSFLPLCTLGSSKKENWSLRIIARNWGGIKMVMEIGERRHSLLLFLFALLFLQK